MLRSAREDEAPRAELRHAKVTHFAYYIWQVDGEQSGMRRITG